MKRKYHLKNKEINPDSSNLPLCANEDYYRSLDPHYPRPRILCAGRWLLTHFILDALGILGLLVVFVQNLISDLLSNGLQIVRPLSLWQLFIQYPLITGIIVTICLLLVPVGWWLRADEQHEQEVLERRAAGISLSNSYRMYLEHVIATTGALPPLLQRTINLNVLQSSSPPAIPFSPLRLLLKKSLDLSDEEEGGNNSGKEQSKLIVDQATCALAHARNGAIVVLGQPGTGKTTLLHHLACSQAQAQLHAAKPGGRVPIFLDLAHPDVAARTIKDSIEAQVTSVAGINSEVASRIVNALSRERWLVLIDGLDEMLGNTRTGALGHINAFALDLAGRSQSASATTLPTNQQAPMPPPLKPDEERTGDQVAVQVIVGSRMTGYRQGDLNTSIFETWELLPLTDTDAQRQLIENVLRVWTAPTNTPIDQLQDTQTASVHLEADQLLGTMQEPIATWATNPLLLTLVTIGWATSGGKQLSRTRTALYRNAIEVLMNQRMQHWSAEERTMAVWLAECAALELFRQGRRTMTMRDFTERIVPQLPAILSTRRWSSEQLGPGDVFFTRSSLFIQHPGDQYGIYHLTFLEYLAARALAQGMLRQWPAPVVSTAILDELRRRNLLTSDPLGLKMHATGTDTLTLLWSKRTTARWHQVLLMMTGTLSETPETDDVNKTLVALHRLDVGVTWIHALLDQPKDIGLLGLRLAADCIGELEGQGERIRMLAQDVAERLVKALLLAHRNRKEARRMVLKWAWESLYRSAAGSAAANSLREQLDEVYYYSYHRRDSLRAMWLADKKKRKQRVLTITELQERLDKLDCSWYVRDISMRAIKFLKSARMEASPNMQGAFTDSDNTIQATADIINLKKQLTDPFADVRYAAVMKIGTLGPTRVETLPELKVLLSDPDFSMRLEVIKIIGTWGSTGIDATPQLLEALLFDPTGDEYGIHKAAAVTLVAVNPDALKSLLPELRRARVDGRAQGILLPIAQQAELRLYREAGATTRWFLNRVMELLNSPYWSVRREAATVLGNIGRLPDTALHALLHHCQDSSLAVREAANEALEQILSLDRDVSGIDMEEASGF